MKFKYILILLLFIFSCKERKSSDSSNIRIVSLAPSITKILFRLELEDNIVGVTDFCEYYGKVEDFVKSGKIKRLSGFNIINYENILSVNPTHILGTDSISYENKLQIEKIFSNNRVYWFIHPTNFDGIKRDILTIGRIFGKEERAKILVKEIDINLYKIEEKIKNKKNRPKVLVEIFYPPFTTAGKNTFISDIIIKSGGSLALLINENWPTLSLEDIVVADPDIVIKTHLSESNKELNIIRCYKENKIFIPKDIDIFLQPSYESIFAVKELYEYLYENN